MNHEPYGPNGDVVAQADAALRRWEDTGHCADAEELAPMVFVLISEVKRLRAHVANLEVGQSNQCILLKQAAVDYSRAIGEDEDPS